MAKLHNLCPVLGLIESLEKQPLPKRETLPDDWLPDDWFVNEGVVYYYEEGRRGAFQVIDSPWSDGETTRSAPRKKVRVCQENIFLAREQEQQLLNETYESNVKIRSNYLSEIKSWLDSINRRINDGHLSRNDLRVVGSAIERAEELTR